MNNFTKIITLMVGTGLVTTLILPDRQTTRVLDSLFRGASQFQGTVMGTRKS
jgi:hypothetical protein